MMKLSPRARRVPALAVLPLVVALSACAATSPAPAGDSSTADSSATAPAASAPPGDVEWTAPPGSPQAELPRVAMQFTCPSSSPKVDAELADTPITSSRGLSHHEGLGEGQGMLFPNLHPPVAVTVAEMRFALDIVWLDADGAVLDIARNVEPSPAIVYSPPQTHAFLELSGGSASTLGIEPGCSASW